jgi:CubicO group peptidase (beta-lactamase class C family)
MNNPYSSFRITSLLLFSAILMSCGDSRESASTHESPDPQRGTPVEAQSESGLDMSILESLDREFVSGKHGYIDSMLVMHGDEIIFEKRYPRDYDTPYEAQRTAQKDGLWAEGQYNYYDPAWHPWLKGGDIHSMQSVSKSVTSALIGIAIGQGAIESVDVEINRFFDHPNPFQGDPRGQIITLRDLLTMSAGIDWNEADYGAETNDCTIMEGSDDWVQYVLDQGISEEPGALFNYNSGISVLLDQILFTATGKHADTFGQEYLFGPLDIEFYWKITPTGVVDTEGGLYLSPRGLARIGQLYANDGVWQGQRILPEGWVDASFAPAIDVPGPDGWKYGYQWWLTPDPQRPGRLIPTGLGFGGQRLLLLPEDDVIAVFTGWNVYEYPTLSVDYVLERLIDAARGG